jgi:hypothetical protein
MSCAADSFNARYADLDANCNTTTGVRTFAYGSDEKAGYPVVLPHTYFPGYGYSSVYVLDKKEYLSGPESASYSLLSVDF